VHPADPVDQQWWRDQERLEKQERVLRPVPAPLPEVIPEALPAYPVDEQPCRTVLSIRLQGEENAQFQFALTVLHEGPHAIIGRCLGKVGMSLAAKHVHQAILAQGYLTTSVVAEDITPDGQLRLTVLPGRLGQVRFDDGEARASEVRFALPLVSGDLLNLRALEQALETWSRLPNTEVSFQVLPTEHSGISDLVVRWRQGARWRSAVTLDNAGSPSTGRHQGSVNAVLGNLLGINEMTSVNVTHSLGDATGPGHPYLLSVTGQLTLPFGYWRLDTSWMRSQSVQDLPHHDAPRYVTQNRSEQLMLSRTLYRDAHQYLEGFGQLALHQGRGELGGRELDVQTRRGTQWDVGVTYRRYRGAASASAMLAYRRGSLAFGALPAPESDAECCLPKMVRWELSATLPVRWQALAWVYRTSWRGQWNQGRVSAVDRFALGSRYTVRGYDEGALVAGDDGMVWRQEGAVALGSQQLYVAYDVGRVEGSVAPQWLSGGGVGVRGGVMRHVDYEVFAGWGRTVSGCQAGHPVVNASLSWRW
jgi:hemolysin activation/secretion protein